MSEWPMGALPPIISMRVSSARFGIPGTVLNSVKESRWPLATGGTLVIKRPEVPLAKVMTKLKRPVTLGELTTVDGIGQVNWRLLGGRQGVFATQANPVNPETGKREWFHFLDSMNQDVTPYVHAAVARLGARLLGLEAQRLSGLEPQCLACKAFRRLPGPDQVLGDVESRVPSLSTIRMSAEGPWQAEAYWCSARQQTPPDVERLVREHNEMARRGYPDPVLPLDRAGESCELFLPKNAGRHGGIPLWEIPAGYADEPEICEQDGARMMRVRGAQWEVELSIRR